MKKLSFIVVFLLLLGTAFGQQFSISGKIQEAGTAEGVPFANLFLLKTSDSTQLQGAVSDIDGNFRFNNVSRGEYLIRIQLLGYMTQVLEVDVEENVRLGVIPLAEEATDLSEVVVQARRPTGTVRGDTTAFNADAFKTMPDASAQTLLEKMPGIDRDGGTLQAQGETIAQILVDGKPFFGTDVAAALQNLPAEVIQSIEIFDQQSELSQMTGFDDGQRLKTINIITKPDRRKGQFGRGTAGYGSDERYLLGASVNFFDEDRRLTITGLSNNINIQKYAADPNAQNDGNPQQGIITTNLLGFNYSDSWSEKLKVTASYTFTETENFGLESRFREFVTEEDNDQTYDENSRDVRISRRHQADMRLEYQINERNRLVYIPRFSARFENEDSGFEGITRGNAGALLNTVENSRIGRFKDLTTFHRIFYSHKFAKEGRTLSARFRFRKSLNEDESNRVAVNTFFMENMSTEEILDQLITRERVGTMWNTRLSFTEPLGENSLLALEYGLGNRKDDSEQLLFDIISDIGPEEVLLDTALSNVFFSNYFTQQYQAGYQYNTEKLRFQTELQFQDARLNNDQIFPSPELITRRFQNVLPSLRFEYRFTPKTNVQFDYDTYTNEPQVEQLQAAINNNNPLQLRTGNPELDQAFTNRMRVRFRSNNPDTDRNWFLFAQARFTDDLITNSVLIAEEPIVLDGGVVLQRGSQLNRPVNLDGYREFRSWFSYGFPVDFIKSNLSLNTGFSAIRRPGQINDLIGFNNSLRYSAGFSLSSNISERVDFNLWSRSSFNQVENNLNPRLNNDFFQQRTRFNFNWIIWQGFIYRLDVNHQINRGLAPGFDADFVLVNMSLGKKIFKNQRGEVSLMVYDLFGQNANVRRNITETFIEDVQSNVLQQYVMLTFTYNLRRFSKGMTEGDLKEMF